MSEGSTARIGGFGAGGAGGATTGWAAGGSRLVSGSGSGCKVQLSSCGRAAGGNEEVAVEPLPGLGGGWILEVSGNSNFLGGSLTSVLVLDGRLGFCGPALNCWGDCCWSSLTVGGGGWILLMSGSSYLRGGSVVSELVLEMPLFLEPPVATGDTSEDADGDEMDWAFCTADILAFCCDSSFIFCILILKSLSLSFFRCSASVLFAFGGGGPYLVMSNSIKDCLNFGSSTGGSPFFFLAAAGSAPDGENVDAEVTDCASELS
ncbi:hypothetical protein OGAPHI_003010 [Ogataea philodendri]|uniref:Uncharacterized protein n=1 Tax=Ogataea philodendri TaxID=1378263 RepID=A0A9P8P921_9ASCO|nr:uncharacterized protein OGAPHI_003010 [Ogataea philodendri]KAH3667361.1 hypothetical protein OGAPHI_003010 [Ogataea philodendri]